MSRSMPRACGGGLLRRDGRFRSGGLAAEEALLAPAIEIYREGEPGTPQQICAPHVAEPVMAEIDARRSHQDDEQTQEARDRRPAPGGFEKSESQEGEVAAERRGRENMAAGESGRVQLAHNMDQVGTGTWPQNDHLDHGADGHVA